jgi:hypothetical protein
MPNETKFRHVPFDKLENDAIVKIDAKAPNAVRFGMKLFGAQGGVERILFEKLGFRGGFALDFLSSAAKSSSKVFVVAICIIR